jgi:Chaperone of endosialidase
MTPLDGASDVIFFEGVRHISAREAARNLGVVRDYVARLCRQGKIRGRQVGRNWYAEVPSLQHWAIEQDHQRALRGEALSRERAEERRAAQSPAANRRNTTPSTYVDDRTVATITPPASVASPASRELHRKLASAASRGSAETISQATALSARAPSDPPLYAVSPAFNILHKVAAAALAVMLVVGLYAVGNSLVAASPNLVPGAPVTPQVDLAAAPGLVSNTLSNIPYAMQSGVAFLAPFFWPPVAPSNPESAVVSLQIIGGGPNSLNAQATASVTPRTQSATHTIIENNPIVERVIQGENAIAPGGITESDLDQKLQQLNNSLSEKIYSLTSANSTAIAQNYNVTAQTNAIDQLTNTTITNPAISGGSISGASIAGATISGATFSGTTTLQALSVSGSATSTYAAGIEITSGCFAIGGTCITGNGGGTPGGASAQVQFNSGGSFAGASTFTFSTSTGLLSFPGASTTLFSAYGPAYFGATATSSFGQNGALTLSQALGISSGGTGTSTAPSYGELLVGNSSGGYNLVSTSSLGIVSGGGSSNVSTSSQNTWSALQFFAGNASSSNFSNFGVAYFGGTATSSFNSSGQLTLAGISNSLLSTNASGQVVSTTSIGTNLLSANTISGVALGGNLFNLSATNGSLSFSGSYNGSSAQTVGLNLGNSDWWTANQNFTQASTSQFTATSSVWFTNVTSALLATDQNGKLVSTTTIGNSLLTNAGALSVSAGSGLLGGGPVALGGSASLSLDLTHANSWTGLQQFTNATSSLFSVYGPVYFGGTATSSFNGAGQLTLANLASSVLAVNSSGQVIATSSIGTNLLTGTLGTINGTTLSAGGSVTITAASSTLLANNNSFSGNNAFSASTTFSNLINIQNASSTALSVSGNSYLGTAQSTAFAINSIVSCSGSQALQTDGSGNVSCGSIATGGASSGGGWTTNNIGRVALSTTTDLAVVGASTTPYAKLTVLSGSNSTTTLALIPAASQTADILDIYTPGGGLSSVFTAGGSLGLGTTSPGSILSVNGVGNFVSGATSTIYSGLALGNLTVTSTPYFTNITNALLSTNANGQVVATTTIGTNLLSANTISDVALGGTLASLNVGSGLSGSAYNGSASQTFSLNLGNSNWWTAAQNFTNASTSQFTATSSIYFTSLTNALLATDQNGKVVSTTTIGNSLLTNSGALTVAAGSGLSGGGSVALGGSTSLLLNLGNSNWWTAAQNFTNASTSQFTATSSVWFAGVSASSLLALDNNNKLVATSSIGANLLTGSLGTINGANLNAGSSITVAAASSTALIDNNTFSGTTTLSKVGNASSTLTTLNQNGGSTWFSGLASALLGTDNNGKVVSTTTIGTNLLSANTISGVALGGTLASLNAGSGLSGSGYNGSAGQTFSLNLANSNWWTAIQNFTNASTSEFTATSSVWFTGVTASSLLAVDNNGKLIATTTIGTNLLSANTISGVALGSNLFSLTHDSTLSGSSYNGSAVISNWGVNLANANNWTGLQQFSNSSSTLASVYSALYVGDTATTTIKGSATSTFGAGISATVLNVTSSSATSTFANGISLSGGCILSNGSCIGANSGTVSSGTQGQFAFYAANGSTISGTSTLFVTTAGNIGIGTTTPGDVSGANQYLTIASTGGNTFPSLELSGRTNTNGNALGRISFYNQVGQSEDAQIKTVIGTDTGSGSLVFSTANAGSLAEAARIDNNGNLGIGTTTPGSILSVNGVGNFVSGATSTIYNGLALGNLTVTSTPYFTNITNALLSSNGNGQVVASTSVGTNYITGVLGTINGTSFSRGGSISVTGASSTILSDDNTLSGTTTLSKIGNASSTLTTLNQNSGSTWFLGLTSALLGTDNNGKVVASTTIGTNLLSANTISGVALGGTLANLTAGSGLSGSAYNGSGSQTFSLNLGNSNWWTATQNFTNASTSQFTATSSVWFTSLASAVLAVDNNGKLIATSTIGSNVISVPANSILAGNSSGSIIASTTIGWNLLKGPASSIFAFDSSGNPVATTSIGVNYLTGVLPIANGGTNQASQTTNGVNYFDGTHITSGNLLAFLTGTLFVGTSTPSTSASLFVTASTSQSGNNLLFSVASTTGASLLSINGNGTITQSGITNSLIAADNAGKLIASTTIGTNLLSANTISGITLGNNLNSLSHDSTLSGTSYNGSGAISNWGLNLANANIWTGLQQLTNASTTIFSSYGPAYFGASATSSFGTNGSLTLAGLETQQVGFVSQASSTVVGNFTSTGNGIFGGTLALNGTSGTTTLASGQGFTIGSSQFVLQQGSGNVGIGTTSPQTTLHIQGSLATPFIVDTTNSSSFMQFRSGDVSKGYFGYDSTDGDISILNAAGNLPLFTVTSGGNVGVGPTTTPATLLSVAGSGYIIGGLGIGLVNPTSGSLQTSSLITGGSTLTLNGTSGTTTLASGQGFTIGSSQFVLQQGSGNVGIGTSNPSRPLDLAASRAAGSILAAFDNTNNASGLSVVAVFGGLNSVDTTTHLIDFYDYGGNSFEGGIVRNGAAAVAYDTSSDRRIKENIATTTLGLAQLMQLPVRSFDFISDPTHATTTGFIAQELFNVFPWAVTTNGDNGAVPLGASSTPWGVDYGRITPLIVKAVQDIATISSTFEQNLIAWLSNAQNGIKDLYATVIHAKEVDAQELCVSDSAGAKTCITKAQLDQLLANAATIQSSGGTSSSSSSASSSTSISSSSASPAGDGASKTPPQISVNGNNPATVQVGATYLDLGATITGPQADLNLGIRTFLNGFAMSPAQLDTSQAATDTIDYVATDQNGLAATSTRTVLIVAPKAANDNQASSTPPTANDNLPPLEATGTTATTTP